MKYRPPRVGEQKHRPPLAAVTATLAVVRRLLERDGERRAWFLRGADRSCGLRAWNSYLPGCLGGGALARKASGSAAPRIGLRHGGVTCSGSSGRGG